MAAMSALLAVAVCGAMAAPLLQSTRRSADPLLSDLAAAAEGAVSPGGEKSLATLAEKAPDDAIMQFFLAGQARGLGHHALALRAYRRAAELDPQLAQASNNLGTLLASLGREASAVQAFHRAIQAAPSDLIAYYNLYLTQQHRFDFEAAEQTLAQAQKIDLPGITALMSQRNERQARLNLIEARLPVQIALDHALKALNPSSPASSLRPMFLSWSWPLVVLPLGTVFLLLGRRRRPGWPVSCGLCGRITCKHCALDSGRQSRCASCQALAGQQRSLPRMVRKKKKAAIAAYQRRKARTCRALAVLIPGAGQIWAGRAVAGSLLLVTASIAALALILGPSLPEFPRIVMEPGLSGPSLGAILLLLCTWMASWILPVSSPEATRTLRARSRRT
ncbi:MAG: hypothetical protein ACE5ID_11430 [Acidobacteriota bacterium]